MEAIAASGDCTVIGDDDDDDVDMVVVVVVVVVIVVDVDVTDGEDVDVDTSVTDDGGSDTGVVSVDWGTVVDNNPDN